jgi:predicted transcriptional regulator
MQEYVRSGRSLRSVAQDYALSVGELRELIVGYGLPLHQGVVEQPHGTAALTTEYLQREYVQGGRTAGEIAVEVGVSEQSVLRYLHRAGIPVRRGGGSALADHLTQEFLEHEYVEMGRTAGEIASEVGVSEQSVLRYLHRYGIALRSRRRANLGEILTEEYLRREYVEGGRSVSDLAVEHGVSDQAIRNWLKKRGFTTRRGTTSSVGDRLSFAYLHREYELRKRSVSDIAAEIGVSEQSVLRYLHKHEIDVRRGRAGLDAVEPDDRGVRGRPAWLDSVLTEEFLRREYVERGRSASQIGERIGASEQSVLRYLHRHGIEVRPVARSSDGLLTPEYLHEQYVVQGRSLGDIGREHEVSGETVRKWLERYGIERRRPAAASSISRELLERRYVDEQRSIASIAEEFGVSPTTIAKHLDRWGVPRREAHHGSVPVTRDLLDREYVQRGRTMAEIGEELGVSSTTVRKYLDRFGIAPRPKNSRPLLERVLSREFLEREYVANGRTARDLAREVGVSEQTVLRYLHRRGLDVRPAGFGPTGEDDHGDGVDGGPVLIDAEAASRIAADLLGDPTGLVEPSAVLPANKPAGRAGDEEAALRAWLKGESTT